MRLLFVLSTLCLLFSCNTTEEVIEVQESEEAKPQRNVKLKAIIGDFKDSDPLNVNSVRLEGNTLFIEVSYSGGCEQHDFWLVGNPNIMKSLPPKRSIKIIHDNNMDACRSVVTTILEVDITELGSSSGEIVLVLDGWEEGIAYTIE